MVEAARNGFWAEKWVDFIQLFIKTFCSLLLTSHMSRDTKCVHPNKKLFNSGLLLAVNLNLGGKEITFHQCKWQIIFDIPARKSPHINEKKLKKLSPSP